MLLCRLASFLWNKTSFATGIWEIQTFENVLLALKQWIKLRLTCSDSDIWFLFLLAYGAGTTWEAEGTSDSFCRHDISRCLEMKSRVECKSASAVTVGGLLMNSSPIYDADILFPAPPPLGGSWGGFARPSSLDSSCSLRWLVGSVSDSVASASRRNVSISGSS